MTATEFLNLPTGPEAAKGYNILVNRDGLVYVRYNFMEIEYKPRWHEDPIETIDGFEVWRDSDGRIGRVIVPWEKFTYKFSAEKFARAIDVIRSEWGDIPAHSNFPNEELA